MKEIRCVKCSKLLATVENKWIKIKGNTDYSSNGEECIIKCKCGEMNKNKIK